MTAILTAEKAQGVPRYYYMDAMRSSLMLLVVVLHTANVYSVSKTWLVNDSDGFFLFDVIGSVIAAFAMPTFFIIAGFFSLLSLRKAGAAEFLTNRLRRLAIPLVATALLVNSAQAYVCYLFHGRGAYGLAGFVQRELFIIWKNGGWIGHLWFLNVLIIYSVVTFAVCQWTAIQKALTTDRCSRLFGRAARHTNSLLFLVSLFSIFPLALGKCCPTLIYRTYCFGFIDPLALLHYLPFFLFGIWLFHDRNLQTGFGVLHSWHAIALVSALVVVKHCDPEGTLGEKTLHCYAEGLLTWLLCNLCFWIGRRFADWRSRAFAYLSDASYTVYLFQQFFVVLLALALVGVALNPAAKFVLVLSAAIGAGLLIHHFLVLRIKVLGFLFNGKVWR